MLPWKQGSERRERITGNPGARVEATDSPETATLAWSALCTALMTPRATPLPAACTSVTARENSERPAARAAPALRPPPPDLPTAALAHAPPEVLAHYNT